MHPVEKLIEAHKHLEDLHITRVMGCLVAVSGSKVVSVDRSDALKYCPLQALLSDMDVEGYLREKIEKFGLFTARREICRSSHGVPYGTSEMMMNALKKGWVDCAVSVCDGVGSIVSDSPEVVQGVGARMNGVFYTTLIPEVMGQYRALGAIVFDDAKIDQVRALRRAIEAGHRRIVVTVNGYYGDSLISLREIEREKGIQLTIAAICSTGATPDRAAEIATHADIAWACASKHLREQGTQARLQLTIGIPVLVYTWRGLDFLAAYSDEEGAQKLRGLDLSHQWLLASGPGEDRVLIGSTELTLTPAKLPVLTSHQPEPLR